MLANPLQRLAEGFLTEISAVPTGQRFVARRVTLNPLLKREAVVRRGLF